MGKETKGRTPPASAGGPQAGLSQNTIHAISPAHPMRRPTCATTHAWDMVSRLFQVSYLFIFRPQE
jgi:hypothetical protein